MKMGGKIRSFPDQKKAKRIETSIARYDKGTALRRQTKNMREKGTKVQREYNGSE